MKGVGMLVVSLRGVNLGFWSHLFIFSHEKYKNTYIVCVLT